MISLFGSLQEFTLTPARMGLLCFAEDVMTRTAFVPPGMILGDVSGGGGDGLYISEGQTRLLISY